MRNEFSTHAYDAARAVGNDHRHHLAGDDVIAGDQRIDMGAELKSAVEGFSGLIGALLAQPIDTQKPSQRLCGVL